MKHVDLMIFDLDGTLVNSGGDIIACVNYTLQTLGIPTRTPAEILSFVGDGVQKMIERSLGADFQHFFDEAMKIFSGYYADHMLDTTILYNCVIEVLDHFLEKRKIIITNKRRFFTVEMTDFLGISKYFDEIIGSDSTAYKKPDPRLLLPLLQKYGSPQQATVVIGDGVNDILLARNTGALSCALLNGLTDRATLLSLAPDFALEEISGLIALFE